MKRAIQSFTIALTATLLAGAPVSSRGQDKIFDSLTLALPFCCPDAVVYSSGPSQFFLYEPVEPADGAIDLNQDETPDFSFHLGYFICTADIPVSACSGPYSVLPLGMNAILSQSSSRARLLSRGANISSIPPTNSAWSTPAYGATVATQFFSQRYNTSGLYGPLAEAGVGYVGVRFYAADGWHYGWVRLLATPYVSVVDWAYTEQPDVPICAGDIGLRGGSRQFTVRFPNGETGSLILTGDQLRCELTLNGQFESARLTGPSPARAKGKTIADLCVPLVTRADYTCFFRDVTLSLGEVMQLLRGALAISLDDGALVGSIEPVP